MNRRTPLEGATDCLLTLLFIIVLWQNHVRFGWDVILCLPALRALRKAFPESTIGWAVDSRFQELIAGDRDLDIVHPVPMRELQDASRSPRGWLRAARILGELRRSLRAPGYDVSLTPYALFKSGLVARLAGCSRNLQIEGDRLQKYQWLFPGERIERKGAHTVDQVMALAAVCGADVSEPQFDIHLPEQARATARRLVAEHDFGASGPLVALNPGASSRHKQWPPENFAATARELKRRVDARLIIPGGPGDVELSVRVAREADVGALCTAGRTNLLELGGLLELCDVTVSADTGPQHLAAAVGRPVVALIGPTDGAFTGPYGDQHVILRKDVECPDQGDCGRRTPCRDYRCMQAIKPGDVADAVVEVLGRG